MPEIAMPEIQKILFIELLGGIGDLVIALPAIHAVARSYPLAEMTVLTFAPGNELLLNDPLVNQVICAPKGEARSAVDQLLSQISFDLIISDTNYDGIADAINGCSHQKASTVITNLWRSPPPDELVNQRFLKILLAEEIVNANAITASEPEIYLTATEKIAARQALGALYRPLVFLCSDAGMAIKRWSMANFVTVAQALQHQHGATIVVPVGESLIEAEQLVEAIGGTAQIWQRGSLRQLAAVMAEADLVIAGDTGLAHIAAALQIPTITLFGPSWSGRYGHPSPHINLQGYRECSERIISDFTQQSCWYSNDCPFEWNNCLAAISPEMVLDAANKLLYLHQSTIEHTLAYIHDSISNPISISNSISDNAWKSVRNLLVMRLDNIGDVIMTSPALKALKKNLPQAKLTLMASPAGALTASLLPWVDKVLPWRVLWQDLGKLDFDPDREWQLIETLKAHQFDAAVIFTSFSQSPYPAGLICLLAGIPLRLGESKEQDNMALTHTISAAPDEMHQVERNLRLIEAVGFQVADRRLALTIPNSVQTTALKKILEYQSSNYIAHPIYPNTQDYPAYILLNPWTSCQSRNYPTDRFAIAARKLSKITDFPIVVTGVEKDRNQAQPLLEILGEQVIDLIGRTSLPELVALVAKAQLVLTNNTSVMHIADATETPIIVMFAGTELECQWRPRYTTSRLLRRSTVCNPCYAFACPYSLQCLDILPETVVEAALSLLNVGITR